MSYRYYPYSCARIERACRAAFAEDLHPVELSARKIGRLHREDLLKMWAFRGLLAQHLLWMLVRLQSINHRSAQAAAKRGRWMGWVYAYCEWMGLLTQQQVRTMARRDVHAGNV